MSLGVAPEDILTDDQSPDTETQARNIKEMAKSDKLVLVTSTPHMPRAVGFFRKVGLNPVPAPTHYLSQENRAVTLNRPDALNALDEEINKVQMSINLGTYIPLRAIVVISSDVSPKQRHCDSGLSIAPSTCFET